MLSHFNLLGVTCTEQEAGCNLKFSPKIKSVNCILTPAYTVGSSHKIKGKYVKYSIIRHIGFLRNDYGHEVYPVPDKAYYV